MIVTGIGLHSERVLLNASAWLGESWYYRAKCSLAFRALIYDS